MGATLILLGHVHCLLLSKASEFSEDDLELLDRHWFIVFLYLTRFLQLSAFQVDDQRAEPCVVKFCGAAVCAFNGVYCTIFVRSG